MQSKMLCKEINQKAVLNHFKSIYLSEIIYPGVIEGEQGGRDID